MEQVSGAEPAVPAAATEAPGMVDALKQRFAADLAERDRQHRAELEALRQWTDAAIVERDRQHAARLQTMQQSYVAHDTARNEQYAAQLAGLQQALESMQAQLAAGDAAQRQEAEDRSAAETELQARRAQVAAQHLELETHRAQLAELVGRAAELTQQLANERQASAHWHDRAQRLEEKVRIVAGQSHDAALDAAGRLADAVDAYEDAVQRGDHISEQVAFHEAAVRQMRATIEEQRAAHEQLIEERQAARTRCVELESQLHALTTDARHLAEGLQRVHAERDAERRAREAQVPDASHPPRLRLAGTGDTA